MSLSTSENVWIGCAADAAPLPDIRSPATSTVAARCEHFMKILPEWSAAARNCAARRQSDRPVAANPPAQGVTQPSLPAQYIPEGPGGPPNWIEIKAESGPPTVPSQLVSATENPGEPDDPNAAE
jgi:hypothetical protein